MVSVITQLPNGPSTDSYKLSLFVNIYDNMSAFTTFYIQPQVIVQSNPNYANKHDQSIKWEMYSTLPLPIVNIIKTGDIKTASTCIIMVSAAMNNLSSNDLVDFINFYNKFN